MDENGDSCLICFEQVTHDHLCVTTDHFSGKNSTSGPRCIQHYHTTCASAYIARQRSQHIPLSCPNCRRRLDTIDFNLDEPAPEDLNEEPVVEEIVIRPEDVGRVDRFGRPLPGIEMSDRIVDAVTSCIAIVGGSAFIASLFGYDDLTLVRFAVIVPFVAKNVLVARNVLRGGRKTKKNKKRCKTKRGGNKEVQFSSTTELLNYLKKVPNKQICLAVFPTNMMKFKKNIQEKGIKIVKRTIHLK
jgi:hypothetical protein